MEQRQTEGWIIAPTPTPPTAVSIWKLNGVEGIAMRSTEPPLEPSQQNSAPLASHTEGLCLAMSLETFDSSAILIKSGFPLKFWWLGFSDMMNTKAIIILIIILKKNNQFCLFVWLIKIWNVMFSFAWAHVGVLMQSHILDSPLFGLTPQSDFSDMYIYD